MNPLLDLSSPPNRDEEFEAFLDNLYLDPEMIETERAYWLRTIPMECSNDF